MAEPWRAKYTMIDRNFCVHVKERGERTTDVTEDDELPYVIQEAIWRARDLARSLKLVYNGVELVVSGNSILDVQVRAFKRRLEENEAKKARSGRKIQAPRR